MTGGAPPNGPVAAIQGGILANRIVADGIYWMDVAVPSDWGPPRPGQFLTIAPSLPLAEMEPGCGGVGLLRRPFSIAGFDAAQGRRRVQILYAAVGRVTDEMRRLPPGREVGILGPLGRVFPLDAPEPICLVAGGRGIAPMLFLAHELARHGKRFSILYGTRTAAERVNREMPVSLMLHAVTEDGSVGERGTVIDLLERLGHEAGSVMACGPHGMLAAVASCSARRGIPCWVSIEEVFGCGLGLCGGCAVPVRQPAGAYLWACRDGAVVEATELDWERWCDAAPSTGCDH